MHGFHERGSPLFFQNVGCGFFVFERTCALLCFEISESADFVFGVCVCVRILVFGVCVEFVFGVLVCVWISRFVCGCGRCVWCVCVRAGLLYAARSALTLLRETEHCQVFLVGGFRSFARCSCFFGACELNLFGISFSWRLGASCH